MSLSLQICTRTFRSENGYSSERLDSNAGESTTHRDESYTIIARVVRMIVEQYSLRLIVRLLTQAVQLLGFAGVRTFCADELG